MKIIYSNILVLLIATLPMFSQKVNNNWNFGNGAAINFDSGFPVSVSRSQLYTEEGSASVSDDKGRLLFYTNGVTVWDRNHKPMPNGTDLAGHVSATQSAVIVPKPGSFAHYYIFTVDEKGGFKGLSYSIVDMMQRGGKKVITENQKISLTPDLINDGGLGDVIQKNTKLLSPASEKIAIAKHANGNDYWIVCHRWNSDEFYSFLLSAKGLASPVVSKAGLIHKDYGSTNNGEAIGYMKISHDAKKLASVMCYKPNAPIELFSFDNESGKVSDAIQIPSGGYGYGLEFSPDNSKLYVSFLKGSIGIKQYDLNMKDLTDSDTDIAKRNNDVFAALQIGPDGKIYVAKTGNTLGVINFPDKKGLNCNYDANGVALKTGFCVYGLPSFIPSALTINPPTVSKPVKMLGRDTALCATGYLLSVNPVEGADLYLWSTGERGKEIFAKSSGKYVVKAMKKNEILATDSVNVTITNPDIKVNLGNDTTLCGNSLILDAGIQSANYKWSNGETNQKTEVKNSGTYSVTVTKGKCSASSSKKIIFSGKLPSFNYLPRFEPENTFINNYFAFGLNDVSSFEIKIFSDKGKLVFESSNPADKWKGTLLNGKPAPEGEYKWEVDYVPLCPPAKPLKKEGVVYLDRPNKK
jgi:hypothetical protein